MSETPEQTPDVADVDAAEDFDAFWAGRGRKGKRIKIAGETIELPPSLPLQFQFEAQRLEHSTNDDDVRKLVAILFGEDRTEAWAEAGMDLEQFKVLLAWAPQVMAGKDVTLAQVADMVARAEAATKNPTKRPTRKR